MSKKPRKKHVQLTLASARKPDGKHGGWRPGAGRPRKPGSISHDKRSKLNARCPKHVTVRMLDGARSIASDYLMKTIRECIRRSNRPEFRIVEFNILTNHIHLVTEADSCSAHIRGVQGFEVRFTRNVNRIMKRTGKLVAHRYHVRELTSPTEVRLALRYVLQNRKHHDAEKKFSKTWFDPWSSAAWFDGWSTPLHDDAWWKYELLHEERPTAQARTWLLKAGWKPLGLLRLDEAPAPAA